MKQVLPVDSLVDTDLLPDAYTARFRAVFSEGEIAYPGSHDYSTTEYGTVVPVAEAALLTSQANPAAAPVGTSLVAVSGMVAYNIFTTLQVTPNFSLELAWDLRF